MMVLLVVPRGTRRTLRAFAGKDVLEMLTQFTESRK